MAINNNCVIIITWIRRKSEICRKFIHQLNLQFFSVKMNLSAMCCWIILTVSSLCKIDLKVRRSKTNLCQLNFSTKLKWIVALLKLSFFLCLNHSANAIFKWQKWSNSKRRNSKEVFFLWCWNGRGVVTDFFKRWPIVACRLLTRFLSVL